MDKKKIFSKKIIIPVILLVLVLSITSIFLVAKNSKKDKNNIAPEVEVVNQTKIIENEINKDVTNRKICSEYNGNYTFKSVLDITFDEEMSDESEKLLYKYISGCPDKNSFIYYMNTLSRQQKDGQIISLIEGKYTKSKNKIKLESGLYYGNLNKSYVFVEDKNGTIEIDKRYHKISFEISLNCYWLNNMIHNNVNSLYIREKYTYDSVAGNYFYITYLYEFMK